MKRLMLLTIGMIAIMVVMVLQTLPNTSVRAIDIELLTPPDSSSLFAIAEIYTLRNREGFLINTHQSHFWKMGDEWGADSLTVEVTFDYTDPVEPFVFWSNASIEHVSDDAENPLGHYLSTTMHISVDTSLLDIGQHIMTVRVQTPRRTVYSHTWTFIIHQRDTDRIAMPTELAPTAEHLLDAPLPIPAFIHSLSTQTLMLDRFSPIGVSEGLCFMLNDANFTESDDPFRPPVWDAIHIAVDNVPLADEQVGIRDNDSPGRVIVCVDTDFLATGTHLATVTIVVAGVEYSYTWAFVVE